MERPLIICDDISDIARRSASKFFDIADDSISKRGIFYTALSGGTTPESLYRLLSRDKFKERLKWNNVQFFWGDERCVEPDHADSNYRMAFNALLGKIDLPDKNIHRIMAEKGERAASDYEKEIRKVFDIQGDAIPQFDLILLGMGNDGHTASLFPGSMAIRENKRLATALYVEKLNTERITITPPLINNALHIIFLISGRKKADALCQVLKGEYMPDKFPAQLVRHSKGEVFYFVDKEAAGMQKMLTRYQTGSK
ncbi:MAG: 6-phosphogluconolactonase [Nitrospirota bacterium]